MILEKTQLPVQNYTKGDKATVFNRNVQLLELHNKVAYACNMPDKMINIQEYAKSFDTEFEKGLDGGTSTAGSGLLQTNYINRLTSIAPQGGVFEMAGAEILRNQPGTQLQFLSHYAGTGSGYQKLASNNASGVYSSLTSVTNDKSGTWYNPTAPIEGYIVETFVRKSLLRGYMGNPNDIINIYQSDFLRRDELLLDEICADKIVLNSGVAGVASAGASVGNLAQTFLNARAVLKARGVRNVDLHLSPNGHNQFISQRANSTGQFLLFNIGNGETAQYTPIRNADGTDKEVGLVGTFEGSKVYINNGVRDVYTTTGNNISAVTGGSNTAMLIGDSRYVGAGTGISQYNETTIISDTETARRLGVVSIFRDTAAGGEVMNPQAWTYFAFSA